jgi:hypothetical protein
MFRVILIATDGTEAGDAAVAFARNLAVSREQAVMFKRPYTEGQAAEPLATVFAYNCLQRGSDLPCEGIDAGTQGSGT